MSSDSAGSGVGLWTRLAEDALSYRSSLHCWSGDEYDSCPWPQVVREAEGMTAGLRRAGVRPGTRVAAVLTNHPRVVRGLLAVWLAGGAVASLPVPGRGMDLDEYGEQLVNICDQLEPSAFLVEGDMSELVPEELRRRVPVHTWESFDRTGRVDPAPPGDDEVAFIQYSSGSTSTPKGCALTPRAIVNQLELLRELIDARPGWDVGVTWLPLSHDMGMFGCLLTAWWNDVEYYLSTPERFMFSPGTWLSDMARFGGTLTTGTTSALFLAARAVRRTSALSRELSPRVCIIGAERIEWDTLRYATDQLEPCGFRERALMPAYGLAEATLAVTATPMEELPRHVWVDSAALADGTVHELDPDDPSGTALVSSGRPCGEVELPGARNDSLEEISVRSPCLALGYYGDTPRTSEHFRDGTLLTNDLGFVRDGNLYPVGRVDDMLSVAGRKVYAQEIEKAIDSISDVRRGCSTLVARHDGAGPRLTLFLEPRSTRVDYRAIAEQAAALAMTKSAIALDECVFLERNRLPKTPTGKIKRHSCHALLDRGDLDPLATVRLGSM